MPRYNIVLTPTLLKDSHFFQRYSQENFHTITSGYLLGEESLPHISVCQFECTEAEFAAAYPQIIAKLSTFTKSSYDLDINGFNVIKLGGQFSGQQAVEFNVSRKPDLMELHNAIIAIVQDLGIAPLNAKGDQYRPHLTLAFFHPEKAYDYRIPIALPQELEYIKSFTLAIGEADLNWQFNKIIKNFSKGLYDLGLSGEDLPVTSMSNLTIIPSSNHEIIASALSMLARNGAHFTNGTYAYGKDLILPTTLAGFKYISGFESKLPFIVAVNSDTSIRAIGKNDFEPQAIRACKIAAPLAEHVPGRRVIIIFFNETTPVELYNKLQQLNMKL